MFASPGVANATWKVVHAKAAGVSHLENGAPCQDAVDWRRLPSGFLAAALADGAGSAALAEIGANLAVYAALRALQNAPANRHPAGMEAWSEAIWEAFLAARQAIQMEAEAAAMPLSAYATTLICLVAGRDGLVMGQVGDGAVVGRAQDGALYTLARPQRGEYANETLFLTMPDALEGGVFQALELDLSALAMMSDGLIRLALQMPDYTPYPPFFDPLWQFALRSPSAAEANPHLEAFLTSPRVCARTEDDKSLLVAALAESEAPPPPAVPGEALPDQGE